MGTDVYEIGVDAFNNCEKLRFVYCSVDEETIKVELIGNNAFYNNLNLETIEIDPSKVLEVGSQAFMNATKMTSLGLSLATSLRSIGANAFSNTGLTAIVVLENVEDFDITAFTFCTAVTTVNIETEVFTEIAPYMFQNFTFLTSVSFTDKVTTIGAGAFAGTIRLASFVLPSGVLSIGDEAFRGSAVASFVSNDVLETIGSNVFADNILLTSIVLSPSLKSIGESAFMNCTALTTVATDYFLYPDASGLITIDGQNYTSVNTESSLETVGDYAFYGASALTSFSFPSSLTSIGEGAFEQCTALTTVSIAEGNLLTNIGEYAFRDCINLADLNFGIALSGTTTVISDRAFARCYSLESVFIPATVATIVQKLSIIAAA
jgi:hypothetical protein